MKLNFGPGGRRWAVGCGLVVVCFLLSMTSPVYATSTWYVTPTGAGTRDGRSPENAFPSLQQALDGVQPGDTILLGPGDYRESVSTKRHGMSGAPITIVGPAEAVLRGAGSQGRIFQIFHDYYVLDGWTINGYDGSGTSSSDYQDKLLYVHGQAAPYGGMVRRGPVGLEVRNMHFLNAGGECIRLRYFVQYANIHHNDIRNCGLYDFVFGAGGKNGEGIYIGTSSNQWDDGKNPTNEPDGANYNHIHHNVFNTQGNECVEVKEGATGNLIEDNDCTGGKDPEAAGLVSRGDGNIFRYNTTYGHAGGGLRFGGNEANGRLYGIHNDAYENRIYDNAQGGIKFENRPQGIICGNLFSGPNGQPQANITFGRYASEYSNQVAASCNGSTPATATPVPPTNTPTALPTRSPASTPTAIPTTAATPTSTPTVPPPTVTTVFYLSTTAGGTVDQVRFKDEDLLTFEPALARWQLYFDGSDVGIASADVDAFALLPDGSLLLSFVDTTRTPGLGTIDDSDVVRFVPTALGTDTQGSFQPYFDGSDVGLSRDSEDLDALTVLIDGTLLVSTVGNYQVPSLAGDDEDLLAFRPQHLGRNTAGTWSLYFNGSDIGLEANSTEDIFNVWIDQTTTSIQLYLGTRGAYATSQLSGDNHDLFSCTLGTVSACAPQPIWNRDEHRLGDTTLDALAIANNLMNGTLVTTAHALEDDNGPADDRDPRDEALAEETGLTQLFLPLVTQAP